jgi:ribonuclease D
MRVFAILYAWRDKVAREEDESTRYVLPNHMLFRISEVIPSDIYTLFSCCNPVPPLIRLHAHELLAFIDDARREVFICSSHRIHECNRMQQVRVSCIQNTARDLLLPRSLIHVEDEVFVDTESLITAGNDSTAVLTTEQLYTAAGTTLYCP